MTRLSGYLLAAMISMAGTAYAGSIAVSDPFDGPTLDPAWTAAFSSRKIFDEPNAAESLNLPGGSDETGRRPSARNGKGPSRYPESLGSPPLALAPPPTSCRIVHAMIDNRPAREQGPALLPRLASRALETALETVPVVVVMGARQTGKSTLVKTHPGLGGRPYLTLDDFDLYASAEREPDDLVRRAPELIIDEVQRVPMLVRAIKRAVDSDVPRRLGRFVLTGSANLLLMEKVSETLAGRAAYVTLWPLTRRELGGEARAGIWRELLDAPVEDWYDLVRSGRAEATDWKAAARIGGYPSPAHELTSRETREVWFRGYVQTYLERDLQSLAAIENLVDFRRLMRAMALRVGGVVNRAEIGRDTGISRPTVHRHIDLLEASCQLIRVEAYSVNRTKRLIKSPKYYWSDPGLGLFLSGEETPAGQHLEGLVLSDLAAWRESEPRRPEILYWRTTEGEEVDFVIEDEGRLLPIEVKAAARPRAAHSAHLRTFLDQYPDKARGALLLHTGDEVFWASRKILAAPWWRIV